MTSAEDFHILSLRNVLGLIGIGVAVMIPTALKWVRIGYVDPFARNEKADVLFRLADGYSRKTSLGWERTKRSSTNPIFTCTMSLPIPRSGPRRMMTANRQTMGMIPNGMPGWG